MRSISSSGNTNGWIIEIAVGDQPERIAGGTWPTEAEAQAVIRQLVDGRSAEDYVN